MQVAEMIQGLRDRRAEHLSHVAEIDVEFERIRMTLAEVQREAIATTLANAPDRRGRRGTSGGVKAGDEHMTSHEFDAQAAAAAD